MQKKFIGLLILVIVIIGVAGYSMYMNSKPKAVNLNGYIGGEKIGLIEDPEFKKHIKDKYNMTLDYQKAGSIDMVQNKPDQSINYLFPSSQVALDLFKTKGYPAKKSEIVFNTPIVIYSKSDVVPYLEKAGIVYKKNSTYYIKMDRLTQAMVDGRKWSDIGNDDLYSKILVDTTDPLKSNSGNMFLGLLANALNNNTPVDEDSIQKIKPDLVKIYQAIGHMYDSSSDMFKQFMSQGMVSGALPLVAGYENQILEYAKMHPEQYKKVRDKVVILYPEPTVWSSHVFISLDDDAKIASDMFISPEVQKIAWENHGFRGADTGSEDTKSFGVKGVAPHITKIMQMPDSNTMIRLMQALQ